MALEGSVVILGHLSSGVLIFEFALTSSPPATFPDEIYFIPLIRGEFA